MLFCVHEPGNKIGDAGATQLAPSLKEMKGLETLDISCKCVVGRWASATVSNGTRTLLCGARVVVLVCRVHPPGDHTDARTQLHYAPFSVCVCLLCGMESSLEAKTLASACEFYGVGLLSGLPSL